MLRIKASPYTKIFWIESQLDLKRSDYNIVFDQTISGQLDTGKLEKVLAQFVHDHVLLNSHLTNADADVFWEQNEGISSLQYFDSSDSQQTFVEAAFDIECGPLYRFGLFKKSHGCFDFIAVFHHVLVDGGSYDELIQSLSDYYNHAERKGDYPKQVASICRTNEVLHQRLKSIRAETEHFWREFLVNAPEKNELPYMRRHRGGGESIKTINFQLAKSRYSDWVKSRSFKSDYNVLLLVWGALIARYNGKNSAHLKYPIAIKEASGLLYGGQVNSVIFPIVDMSVGSFSEHYRSLLNFADQLSLAGKKKCGYLPIFDIVKAAGINELNVGFAKTNLKDKSFVFDACDIKINHRYDFDIGGAELALEYEERKSCFNFRLKYRANLFADDDMACVCTHYLQLLQKVLTFPDVDISKHNFLSWQEYQQIVYDWNRETKSFTQNLTIIDLFRKQVFKTPDRIALEFEKECLTYKELDQRANQLARHISMKMHSVNQQLAADTLIPICINRGLEMLIGILGILKVGAAYVPIEPSYPNERIRFILEDIKSDILLTQCSLRQRVSEFFKAEVIYIDGSDIKKESCDDFILETVIPSNLAYVIYTSGTTGQPKGVVQTHGNVVQLFLANAENFNFTQADVWTLYHSYVFDFSVWEIWGALFYGGRLLIPSALQVKDIEGFYRYCIDNRVTVLNQTPSAFYQFIEIAKTEKRALQNLKYVVLGGEALNIMQLEPWWEYICKVQISPQLINMYGITEITVHATFKTILKTTTSQSNIGKRLADFEMYVLDQYFNPVSVGIPGELYIGGNRLAPGYLHQPKLTAERFISSPFVEGKNTAYRLYKTGDMVKWLPNGDLEYLGRNDAQVKIRGYRIELGEIEKTLSLLPGIQQNCVLIKGGGMLPANQMTKREAYLIAYYVSSQHYTYQDLVQKLAKKLPKFMIPSHFISLSRLPLNVNGKVDRKALLALEPKRVKHISDQAKTDLEKQLCSIFARVLELSDIDIHDDFFEIGGDSIQSIKLVGELKSLGYLISVKDIFDNPTVFKLSKQVSLRGKNNSIFEVYKPFMLLQGFRPDERVHSNLEDAFPASFLQVGMIVELQRTGNLAYHNVMSYRINLAFNKEIFLGAWKELVERHELLRCSFISDARHGYIVLVHEQINLESKCCFVEQSDKAIYDQLFDSEVKTALDISNPGLFRLVVLIEKSPSNVFSLIFTSHHAIEDGWSVATLLADFISLYTEQQFQRPKYKLSYGEFILHERRAVADEKHRRFWKTYLKNYEKPILKYNSHNPPATEISNSLIEKRVINLPNALAESLLNMAGQWHMGVDMILLSAYAKLLSECYQHQDIVLGLVVNNRLEKLGGEGVFGLFLNTVPLRVKLTNGQVGREFVEEIAQERLRLFEHQQYPYAQIKVDLGLTQDIYDCAFTYVDFHIISDVISSGTLAVDSAHTQALTSFPLSFFIQRQGVQFRLSFELHTALINIFKFDALLESYMVILQDLLEGSQDSTLIPKENLKRKHVETETVRPITIDVKPTDEQKQFDRPATNPLSEIPLSTQEQSHKMVLEIWCDVLERNDIGLDDNFFDVGGNSLNLVRLHASLKVRINPDVTIMDLFRYPTIRKYVRQILCGKQTI